MNAPVQELFHEVADLSPDARTRYFAEHDVDEETRREVEALLAFDSGASDFLLHGMSLATSRALPQLEGKGRRCGPYRLVEVIGRGGMGAVYLAERADGEVTQQLAVKLLPPGAGDPQRERFLQERQILASLVHPNIARMLDAGHLDNGQPFLAMEYVEGKPMDVFAAGLGVRQKIGLFLKVCAAVGYLHKNLVVHRDLKPSNILVTLDGEPKLLDFGIAKMLDLATDATLTMTRILTPDYASPEQVTGGRVSTATDIYSLGAVLYQLLTGKTVHEFADHSAEAIVEAVTKREVTRPSLWATELKGDLESILLKALRKDPQERYATVEQFAEDLEAFLVSRPVRARAGNTWYRTRKFLRRYRVPVSAAALVIVSLSAGLYVANRERAVAQRRFDQVRRLANVFVFDVEDRIKDLPGATAARQAVVGTALTYLESLRQEPRADASLLIEIASAYEKVGDIQGYSARSNLGDRPGALGSYKKAASILTELVHRGNPTARLPLASVSFKLGMLRRDEADINAALQDFGRARDLYEGLLRESPHDRKLLDQAGAVYSQIGGVRYELKDTKGVTDAATSAMEVAKKLVTLYPSDREIRNKLGSANAGLARAQTLAGQQEEAKASYRAAIAISEQVVREEPQNVSYHRSLEAHYVNLSDLLGPPNAINPRGNEDAIIPLRKALKISQWLREIDPADRKADFDFVFVSTRIGALLVGDRRLAGQGVRELGETRRILDRLIGSDPNNARYRYYGAYVDRMMGEGLVLLGHNREAKQWFGQVVSAAKQLTSGPSGPHAREVLVLASAHLAALEANSGNLRALDLADMVTHEMATKPVSLETPWVESALDRHLAHAYARMGRPRDAIAWLEKSRQCLMDLKAQDAEESKRLNELAKVNAELVGLHKH
jgi:tetratricopeptide (TPR) repeat protein/predicted Ser/Thr protein kinase